MFDLGTTPTSVHRVKDAIVHILAEEFPISIRQLRKEIFHKFSLRVSYQAVHKEVHKLLTLNVVYRSEEGLALSAEWLVQQRAFFLWAERNYCKRKCLVVRKKDEQQLLVEYA